jgi:8-oxo-dGTP pyrophosphatase MutT (NUDIX family)
MAIDYIPYLRKMIGSKECLSVGLSVLVVDEKEEILLEKRTDNGLYCLPGGSIDLGETVMEGAKREVKEETGLALGDITLFMILSGEKMKLSYPNGDVTDYVDLVFYSQVDSRKITMGKLPAFQASGEKRVSSGLL